MKYTLLTPCKECPFLNKHAKSYGERRLREFASGEFPCHKTAECDESDEDSSGDFVATPESLHCAGALIYLEKRGESHQMMRICERLGLYDSYQTQYVGISPMNKPEWIFDV